MTPGFGPRPRLSSCSSCWRFCQLNFCCADRRRGLVAAWVCSLLGEARMCVYLHELYRHLGKNAKEQGESLLQLDSRLHSATHHPHLEPMLLTQSKGHGVTTRRQEASKSNPSFRERVREGAHNNKHNALSPTRPTTAASNSVSRQHTSMGPKQQDGKQHIGGCLMLLLLHQHMFCVCMGGHQKAADRGLQFAAKNVDSDACLTYNRP